MNFKNKLHIKTPSTSLNMLQKLLCSIFKIIVFWYSKCKKDFFEKWLKIQNIVKFRKSAIWKNCMLNMQMQHYKRFLFLAFLIATYSTKSMTLIFSLAMFGSSTHRRSKQLAYLESWGNFESEICAFYAKKY